MTLPEDDDERLLLHAYVDGELDPGAALAVERRLAADPELAAEHRRLSAMRDVVRDQLPRFSAPPPLRERVMAMVEPKLTDRSERRSRQTAQRFASAPVLVLGLGLGVGTTLLWQVLFVAPMDVAATVRDEVVAGHVRALATGTPFDVASSDRHTVKPWFAGKVTFAPRVFDLAAEGFPLAGGRLDVVQGRIAATLVFRRGKHVVSLTEAVDSKGARRAPKSGSADGFSMIQWAEDGLDYWAVSDAAPAEVEALVAAFRAKARGT